MDIFVIIIEILFFGLPLASAIWFLVSLIRFLVTPKDDPVRAKRKKMMIISAIPAAILCAVFVALLILIGIAVSHM